MMHSSTWLDSMLARFTASRTTMAPSWGAVRSDRFPWNLPTGVRHPEMMTTSSKPAINLLLHELHPTIIDVRNEEKFEIPTATTLHATRERSTIHAGFSSSGNAFSPRFISTPTSRAEVVLEEFSP